MGTPGWRSERGISLLDVLAVVTVLGIIMAITVPNVAASIDSMRLGTAARAVERELQTAKSRAVSKGRPMRIRFNCPSAGRYRITELIGTTSVPLTADYAANRCDQTVYPFPAADNNPTTLPNLDGPVRFLDSSVSFAGQQTIEFWPDGTARYAAGGGVAPWPMIPTAGISIVLVRKDITSTISVNGLGKIQLKTQ